ncbi:hypothetical protein ACIBJE_19480 [Micromonospora sp. NPDC050187]|uniref:hypothetical protein n=1 Tax=Micromonospora sp. NPDC050187 TaxID=3364277 RepID=UPI0037BB00A1
MTSRLEERYRSVLRLLPAAYRQRWEEDMVAAYLDSVDTGDPETTADILDCGRPNLSEVASIVSLAVRLRLGGTDAPPRAYARGQAVRLATLAAVLAHAVMATGGIAGTLWLSGSIAWLPAVPPDLAFTPPSSTWHAAWGLAGYAWVPAYVALVLGHRRVAQAVALLAVVPPLLTIAVTQATGAAPLSASPWANGIVDVVLLLAMAAFPHGSTPVPRRPWLLALPIGILLVPVPLVALQAARPELRLLDWPGLCCALVTAAMLVHLAVRAPDRSARLPWSLALTLLTAATLALRLVTLPDYGGQAQRAALLVLAGVQVVVVLAVGVPVARRAVRALRRLPPTPAGTLGPTAPAG